MKKLTLVTIVALVATFFAVPVMAADSNSANGSEKANWRIAGLWNFEVVIPETKIGSNVISLTQAGKIIIHSIYDKNKGKEILEYSILSCDTTCVENGVVTHPESVKDKKSEYPDPKPEYAAGDEVSQEFNFQFEEKGIILKYRELLVWSQVGENEIQGTVKVFLNDGIVPIAIGTMKGTRPTWKLAGKWNYKAVIPEKSMMPGYTVSGKETGIIDVIMKSGEIEGKEYFDTINTSYSAVYLVNGEEFSDTGKQTYDGSKGELYNVGDVIVTEQTEKLGNIEYTERTECYQVEENKVVGKIYMVTNTEKIELGDLEATRNTNSSSSSGCNAGFGALALLLAVPMFYGKKK